MGPDSDGVDIPLVSARHAWRIYSSGVREAARKIMPERLSDQAFWRTVKEDFRAWYTGYVVEQGRKRTRRAELGTRWKSHHKEEA